MSGIFGFLDPQGDLPDGTAQRMASALALTPNWSVSAHRHASVCIGVVDKGISSGTGEVLHDEHTGRRAVFQGEILALDGADDDLNPATRARRLFCAPLNDTRLADAVGTYAAAIHDERSGQIEIVSDRHGWHPVYYARHGQATLFASQVKALVASGVLPLTLNPDAVALMFSIGELVDDVTMFESVRTMPAAVVARIGPGGIALRQYWRYRFEPDRKQDFKESARRAGELFRQGVERVCTAGRTVGVPLSGGLDSRLILSATPDPARVPSYTWGIQGCRDLRYAERVAAALGSPHSCFVYDPTYLERLGDRGIWLAEGAADASNLHVLPYVETVHQRSPVILDGLAGDVLLGGNFIKPAWWHAESTAQAAAAIWQWRLGILNSETGEALLGAVPYRELLERGRRRFCNHYATYEADNEMSRAMAFLLDNRIRRWTLTGARIFRWLVEVQFPFFDNAFFDHVAQLPHEWRYRHHLYVEMVRQCFGEVARIPTARYALPARTRWPMRFLSAAAHRLNEKAAARTPWPDLFAGREVTRFDLWFRGPLRDFVDRTLRTDRADARGLWRPEGVRQILDRHNAGADHRKLIGVLVGLELFCRLFVDDLEGSIRRFSTTLELPDGSGTVSAASGTTS